MSRFGAHPRDNTDQRLLNELLTHRGEWKLEMPDDKNVYAGAPQADKDNDGMADDWERQHGGDLAPNGHELHQDYDNLEVYLQQLMAERLQAAPPWMPEETDGRRENEADGRRGQTPSKESGPCFDGTRII